MPFSIKKQCFCQQRQQASLAHQPDPKALDRIQYLSSTKNTLHIQPQEAGCGIS